MTWRSLGESNPCFSLERAARREAEETETLVLIGTKVSKAASNTIIRRSVEKLSDNSRGVMTPDWKFWKTVGEHPGPIVEGQEEPLPSLALR